MKKIIVVFSFTSSPRFRLPVKLIFYIAFGSASSASCLFKSIAIIL